MDAVFYLPDKEGDERHVIMEYPYFTYEGVCQKVQALQNAGD